MALRLGSREAMKLGGLDVGRPAGLDALSR